MFLKNPKSHRNRIYRSPRVPIQFNIGPKPTNCTLYTILQAEIPTGGWLANWPSGNIHCM